MKIRVGFGLGTTASAGLDGNAWWSVVDACEELGWDSIWFSERATLDVPDPLAMMAAVAGRTRRETEDMVGYFSQALPMRTRFDGDPTFAALLDRVRDTVLGTTEHQDVPVETLVLELQRQQQRQAPLFRVVLTMQDTRSAALAR